ncbi:hypothetical protein CYMTET_34790 [Cymbomonas tetramitiformis]|uniref:Uncharacterized protein n=1 Tax=Cymbomonas tetramitiformis TaxID=36881 RepID=A0AAE0KPU2_9CHLO|nr:hypothetical protein CYMTET_34790 [Cymbomonas tetramitiformis]
MQVNTSGKAEKLSLAVIQENAQEFLSEVKKNDPALYASISNMEDKMQVTCELVKYTGSKTLSWDVFNAALEILTTPPTPASGDSDSSSLSSFASVTLSSPERGTDSWIEVPSGETKGAYKTYIRL